MKNDLNVCTVDRLKMILDSLSDIGYGNMTIALGKNAPITKDAISINYYENKLLIRNTYYDRQLTGAADELKNTIDGAIRKYIGECYHAGENIKEED